MKTLRAFQITAATAVLIIFSSCNDNLVTQNESEIKNSTSNETSGLRSVNQFKSVIKLNVNETYSFDYSNTGFRTFNSIKVADCGKLSSNYELIGYGDDFITFLECNSENFSVWSIDVRNSSLRPIEMEITLTGSKTRLINPGIVKTETD